MTEEYKPHGRKIDVTKPTPPASRAKHGKALERALKGAFEEAIKRRDEAGIEVHGAVPGLYVQFESQPGVALQVTSLEDSRQGIEVVAVSHSKTDEAEPRRIERATVFVPDGKVKHFLKRFESYSKTTPKKERERRYEDMLDPVATLRLATLRGLWTDTAAAYPEENQTIWWEVWLRRQDGNELERLMDFAAAQEIDVAARRLLFDDRIVTLVRSAPAQLAASIDVLNDLAEVRKAKETATFFIGMGPEDQGEWTKELLDRVTPPSADAPAVCVLDTGVTRGHPLLESSLDAGDCHACDPAWGTHDHHGHGTEMAGLALYGDLTPVLAGTQRVVLRHRLESVKILPPDGRPVNPPDLYGAVTAEAASRAEIQAPGRRRTFSMSIAATDETPAAPVQTLPLLVQPSAIAIEANPRRGPRQSTRLPLAALSIRARRDSTTSTRETTQLDASSCSAQATLTRTRSPSTTSTAATPIRSTTLAKRGTRSRSAPSPRRPLSPTRSGRAGSPSRGRVSYRRGAPPA
jgi:hypothetical protein